MQEVNTKEQSKILFNYLKKYNENNKPLKELGMNDITEEMKPYFDTTFSDEINKINKLKLLIDNVVIDSNNSSWTIKTINTNTNPVTITLVQPIIKTVNIQELLTDFNILPSTNIVENYDYAKEIQFIRDQYIDLIKNEQKEKE